MNLTISKAEFKKLPPDIQEDFFNKGGSILSDDSSVVASSTDGVESPREEKEVVYSSATTPSVLGEQAAPSPSFQGAAERPTAEQSRETRVNAAGQTVSYDTAPTDYSDIEAHTYQFADPVELLMFLDDSIASGKVTLHAWQIQFMIDFAKGIHAEPNQDDPFQALVRACNGSGKDKYCIAPCAVWLCMCTTMRASAIVTSSSGVQLDNQTCAYIEQLCDASNQKIHPKCWKVNYRYYECLDTRSPIMCFATDEPGKAEGYHPLEHGAKMALFESEAKTVPDAIYVAQNKCTGYTHRCIVSTPGLTRGHFYELNNTAVPRKEIEKGFKKAAIDYVLYHITAYECPHLSKNYIEQMKRDLPGGEMGAAFKSQVLAEFGTSDELVVIPYIYVRKAVNTTVEWLQEPANHAGLDLSDGGDETVLTIRNGNKHTKTIPFKFDNTEDTITFLDERFREFGLDHPESLINGDAGGLGKPMLDRMVRMGWKNIRYIDNRNKARYPKTYLNRGTELYFHVRRLFEQGEIILQDDKILLNQLATRYYRIDANNVHRLLSKLEMRSRGFCSPDRADSFVLAFWDYKSTYTPVDERKTASFKAPEYKAPDVAPFDIREWAERDIKKIALPAYERASDVSEIREAISEYNRNNASNKQLITH